MKFTNTLGLPKPFVSAVERDNRVYSDNCYSVTTLLRGTKQILLERRHADEVTCDVSEMIWAIFGTAVHKILEEAQETPTQIKENRLYVPVGDFELTGQFDLYDDANHCVIDYKTASVWKVTYEDYTDWRRQLILYAWMLRQIGFDARMGQIVAILKDWNKRKAKLHEHPDVPVVIISWTFSESDFAKAESWLNEKFDELAKYLTVPDDEIPPCTPCERWHKDDTWAVKKKTSKRATKVFTDKTRP